MKEGERSEIKKRTSGSARETLAGYEPTEPDQETPLPTKDGEQ